jgi:hypothetical protein
VALLVSTSKSVVIRLRPAASTDGGHG